MRQGLGQAEAVRAVARIAALSHPGLLPIYAAAPIADPKSRRKRLVIEGDVPSPMNPPPGCRFHTRCPYAEARCRVEEPVTREVAPGHFVACHLRTGPEVPA